MSSASIVGTELILSLNKTVSFNNERVRLSGL